MSVRQVRSHAARKLLPPPRLQGRTGYYDRLHLERLQAITALQERGYSLPAIGDVFAAAETGAPVAALLGIEQLASASWPVEEPVETTVSAIDEVVENMPSDPAHREVALAYAAEVGLLERDGDRVTVQSPSVLQAGLALWAAGVPADEVTALAARLREGTRAIVDDIVDVAASHVLQPAIDRGDADEITRAAQRLIALRPHALRTTTALLARGFADNLAERAATLRRP